MEKNIMELGTLATKYMEETKDLEESKKNGDQTVVDKFLQAVIDWDVEELLPLATRVYEYWFTEEGKNANLEVHDRYDGLHIPNLAVEVLELI